MSLSVGQSLSFYEILGPLGAGAMGEVYRARDTRLDRDVALKVLPDELADDEERLRRFEREAKSLAALSHPNVAHVYGIDQVEDTCFMAMELVPGEDLEQRLSRGPLPVDEALDICRQIAEGLEAAHEAGVIHRDLKPANVLITPDGKAKVLDFGLAKAVTATGEESSTQASVLTTEEGRLLGTPTYMAPEQARGKPIDKRVDVWAFGCVLFECLTGRRAFGGDTLTDVLAAVVEKEPDLSALPSATPQPLRELIERCLRKDPRRRQRDVGDARVVLEDLASGSWSEPDRPRSGPLVPILIGTTLTAVLVAVWLWKEAGPDRAPRILQIHPITTDDAWAASASWSREAEFIAYSQITAEGGFDVFVKPVRGGTADPRAETPGDDLAPRLSPDGRYLAYVSSSEPDAPILLVAPHGDRRTTRLIDTGIPVMDLNGLLLVLGDRPWSHDPDGGTSLLVSRRGANERVAIHRVDIETRAAEQLTFPGPGEADYAASLSFDGTRIAFQRRKHGGADLWVMPAEGGEPEVLLADGYVSQTPAWRPGDERIVFRRSTVGGYFDLWELEVETGELHKITYETRRVWTVAVSNDDRIAVASSDHDTFLHSVRPAGDGEPVRLNAHTGDNFGARPSHDGSQIAYHSSRTGDTEIWLLDTETRSESRITQNPAMDIFPDWSPDGRELVYISDAEGPFKIFISDLRLNDRRLLTDQPLSVHGSNNVNATVLARWSPELDDPRIAYIVSGDAGLDLWSIRSDGTDARRVLGDVFSFDWFLDNDRGIAVRRGADGLPRLEAVHMETGESRVLLEFPCTEVDVAPDGSAVAFISGPSHTLMNLFVLPLEMPDGPDGLPAAAGEPVQRTFGKGRWHVHNGGWTPDSEELVFTRDEDYGYIFELVEER